MLIALFKEKFGLSRAFGLGAGVTVVRLICGFISIKVTAVYLGPGGLTLVAQINNFINMTHQVISQGVSTATVRLLSEVKQDVTLKAQLLGTVGSLTALLVVLAAVLILPLSALIAPWLLHAPGYTWIVVLSVPALAALVVNGVCLSILNSHGENGRVSASLMVSTVLGLVLFAPACVLVGHPGGHGRVDRHLHPGAADHIASRAAITQPARLLASHGSPGLVVDKADSRFLSHADRSLAGTAAGTDSDSWHGHRVDWPRRHRPVAGGVKDFRNLSWA